MSSNIQNTPMPMMASPLVTSLEQQMHFGGHLMPYPTPISAPTMSTTPQWASELEEEKIFLNFIPLFSFFLAWWPSWLEVMITGHNFGRGPSTDYSTKVWLQLAQWFLRRRFLCEFPLGSYVKLSSAVGPSWSKGRTAEHNFGRGPSNDYFIKGWFQLSNWFQTRRFLCEFPIGSCVQLSSAVGAILVKGPNCRTHFWKITIQ